MEDPTPALGIPLVENDGDTVSVEVMAPDGYVLDEIIDGDSGAEQFTVYFKKA